MKGKLTLLALLLASSAHAQNWTIQPSQAAELQREQLESQQRTEAMVRDMQQDQARQRYRDELREIYAEQDYWRAKAAEQRAKEARQQACVYWVTSPPATQEKLHTWCSRVK